MFGHLAVWSVGILVVLASNDADAPQAAPAAQPVLRACVDPRVELMSILFRLAGNPEYNMDNSESPYADDVEAHFGKFRGHAVVRKARQMRKDHGVGFDAVMSMAILVEDATTLRERVPLEELSGNFDGRWSVDDAREFLAAARSFVKDSDFAAFIAAHQPLYAESAGRMDKILERLHIQAWFDSFFGTRPAARFELVLGLLNGGGNYGPAMRYPDGRAVYYSIIGCWRFNKKGEPVFSDSIAATIAHEFCHSYTNPIVEEHLDQLKPAGERLFARCKAQMQQQAYSNWDAMMRESMVRACVVRYMRSSSGRIASWTEAREQASRGFKWVGDLADLLAEYEAHRDTYPTLDAFMPRVVEFFDVYATKAKPGASEKPAGPDRVLLTPDAPVAGKEVKFTYFAFFGPLAGSKQMTLHYGFDKWQQVVDLPMKKPAEETWELTLQVPPDAKQIDFVFTDGDKWDNNSGRDWHAIINREPPEK
ncbi:MAG TPA: DUF4932 domain-containing protein [Phycisphaerae bacterium]|nr:DUF4932 domain-containing protein [Phycisphaerae bacterium]